MSRTEKHESHSKTWTTFEEHGPHEENELRSSCTKSVINESINIHLEKSLALTRLANAHILLALARVSTRTRDFTYTSAHA